MTVQINHNCTVTDTLIGTAALGINITVYTVAVVEDKCADGVYDMVLARDVHKIMESKAHYTNWIQRKRLLRYFSTGQILPTTNYSVRGGETLPKYGGGTVVEHLISIEAAKMLCMVENTDRGELVRQYFINLELMADEVTRGEAFKAALDNEKLILDNEWSAYYLSDPQDLNVVNKNDEVRKYAEVRYSHACVPEMVSYFGIRIDAKQIQNYCDDHGLLVYEATATYYPVEAWDVLCGIDCVGLFIELFGTNQGAMEVDIKGGSL